MYTQQCNVTKEHITTEITPTCIHTQLCLLAENVSVQHFILIGFYHIFYQHYNAWPFRFRCRLGTKITIIVLYCIELFAGHKLRARPATSLAALWQG